MTVDNPTITALPDVKSTPPHADADEMTASSSTTVLPDALAATDKEGPATTKPQLLPPDIVNQPAISVPTMSRTKETTNNEEAVEGEISSASSSSSVSATLSSTPAPSQDGKMNGTSTLAEAEANSPTTSTLPLGVVNGNYDRCWNMRMNWNGKQLDMRVQDSDLVYDFRRQIYLLTKVPDDRQKLIGLTKGKLSAELDPQRFGTLGIKYPGETGVVKFTMIGTPVDDTFVDPKKEQDGTDDFDVQYPNKVKSKGKGRVQGQEAVAPADDPRNKRLVRHIIAEHPITVMNDPRPGKGLLVLDLDYTMVDTKPLLEGSLPAEECARPGLHDFLELVYPHYDIVIWSQTHWRWLESKLVELGVLGGARAYKICFVSDRTTMFPIYSMRDGRMYKHEVKPLQYFWAGFPQWSAKNTIHIDDLSRNFALNPGEGLRISAYKGAGTAKGLEDRELLKLGPYLAHLATNVDDFTTVDHGKWKEWSRAARAEMAARQDPAPAGPGDQSKPTDTNTR